MKTRLLSIIMLMVMALPALAEEFIVDGIKYATNDDGTTVYVTSNDPKYKGDIVIPASVTYKGKTYVATSIGKSAFQGCSNLTSINIPNGVTCIGESAFYDCSGLTSIIVDPNNTNYDSRDNCNAIIEKKSNTLVVGCQNTMIPESVTSIGESAFQGCSNLTSINIPDGVTSIGKSAFQGCSGLTSIIVDPNNTNYDSRDNCNAIIEKKSNTLVVGCQNTMIPESVTSIGHKAFRDCSGLTSINIPDGVTSIGNSAFYNCSSLTSINIPDGVTSIGDWAFSFCSNLTSFDIPNGVTSIGNAAFQSCSSLTSINIPDGVTSIGDWAFNSCSGLTSVTIGNEVTSIGEYAFYQCSGLTSVTIGNGVTSIGGRAFGNCWNLKKIYTDNQDPNMFVSTIGTDKTYIVPCTLYDQYVTAGLTTEKKHLFTSYVYNNDATTLADGTETAECDHNCGATDTRTVEGTKLIPTGVGQVSDTKQKVIKTIEDGKVVIIRDGKKYDMMGREL